MITNNEERLIELIKKGDPGEARGAFGVTPASIPQPSIERLPEKSIASGIEACEANPFSEWLNYAKVTT